MGLSYKNRPVLLLNTMHRFQKNTHANTKMHNDIINQLRMRAAHMALDVLPQDLTVDSRPADNSQTDSPIGPVFKC